MEEDFDRELKVLVIGNGSVGKTSMIRRFCKGIYTDEYKKTIGVDFLEKALFVDALQEEVRFMVWDTGMCSCATERVLSHSQSELMPKPTSLLQLAKRNLMPSPVRTTAAAELQ